jgi:hypothetical protein
LFFCGGARHGLANDIQVQAPWRAVSQVRVRSDVCGVVGLEFVSHARKKLQHDDDEGKDVVMGGEQGQEDAISEHDDDDNCGCHSNDCKLEVERWWRRCVFVCCDGDSSVVVIKIVTLFW